MPGWQLTEVRSQLSVKADEWLLHLMNKPDVSVLVRLCEDHERDMTCGREESSKDLLTVTATTLVLTEVLSVEAGSQEVTKNEITPRWPVSFDGVSQTTLGCMCVMDD